MTDNDETETTRIALIKRKCSVCGSEAVPLDGAGESCESCATGVYSARTGTVQYEVPASEVESIRNNYAEAVAE